MLNCRTLVLLFIPIALLLACSVVATGRPSTSAPHANNAGMLLDLCAEKREIISEWGEQQMRELEERLTDREITESRFLLDEEKIKQEVREMQVTLRDNCYAVINQWLGRDQR